MKAGIRQQAIGNSKRAEAIGLVSFVLCAVLFALCFSAHAQTSKKTPHIGYLTLLPSPDPLESVFIQGLRELGWVDGQNIAIEYRRAAGKVEDLQRLAGELAHQPVDLILARSTPVANAAKNATATIPIVLLGVADPVRSGFVASLARPGGNITGMSNMMPELAGKRLELLRELRPRLSNVAFLAYSPDPIYKVFVKDAQQAAEQAHIQFRPSVINKPDEIDNAFSTLKRDKTDALIVQPLFISNLGQGPRIADLALKNRLPAISDGGGFAEAGGLLYYGPDQKPMFRRAAALVDKILKGAKPADLPVEQPTKFEFVINLKTAKQIGVNVPQSVLFRADKVIK